MCITPSYFWKQTGPSYEKVPKSCGTCWRCKSNRVNDYVGRSLAELITSDYAITVTLTYRDRLDGAEKVINPRHFQNFIKSLRKKGHKIRYLCVGEYGELRGRVHFHAILFGRGLPPQVSKTKQRAWPHKRNFHTTHWPHGHVYADHSTEESSLRYACKYLLKGDKTQYWFTLSKKPALGAEFFKRKAAALVENDVMPTSFEYLPPGGNSGRSYLMTGATKRDYLAHILEGIRQKKGVNIERLSEWVRNAVEKHDADVDMIVREEYAAANPEEITSAMLAYYDANRLDEKKLISRLLWEDYQQSEMYQEDKANAKKRQSQTNATDPAHGPKRRATRDKASKAYDDNSRANVAGQMEGGKSTRHKRGGKSGPDNPVT